MSDNENATQLIRELTVTFTRVEVMLVQHCLAIARRNYEEGSVSQNMIDHIQGKLAVQLEHQESLKRRWAALSRVKKKLGKI